MGEIYVWFSYNGKVKSLLSDYEQQERDTSRKYKERNESILKKVWDRGSQGQRRFRREAISDGSAPWLET